VVNGGQIGERSAEGLKRLPIWLNEVEPRLLILCHGAQDLLRAQSEDKVRENLRAMVKMARDRGIDVVLLAVPQFGGMRANPVLYEDIAAEFKVPIESQVLQEIVREERYHRDSVHPNAEGYQRVADALLTLIRAAGAL
jgi:lysophospholipase L1-like esterase